MKKIVIRKAKPTDATKIARVHVKTWQAAYKGMFPAKYLRELSIPKRTASWRKHLIDNQKQHQTLVATNGPSIMGFISVGPSGDRGASEKIGELRALYINPKFWHKGIGSALMQRSFQFLKKSGFREVRLWALTGNEAARAFYRAKGWKSDNARKKFKRGGVIRTIVRYKIKL